MKKMKIHVSKEAIATIAEEVSRATNLIASHKVKQLEDDELVEQILGSGLAAKGIILAYLQRTQLYRRDNFGKPYAQVENRHLLKCFRLKLQDLKRARVELEHEGMIVVFEEDGRIQIRLWLSEKAEPSRS